MGRSVTQDGHLVRREPYDNGPFVRRTLRLLEAQGFAGAPRFVGVDDGGHELVAFVSGEVFDSELLLSDAQVASHGRLLRHAHDALAGADLAGGNEVVCHGDAGPHNVVFRGDEAVALIDWEEAAPGERLTDVADVAWCLLDERWEHGSPAVAAHRIAVFCQGYGWADISAVVDAVGALVQGARDRHADLGLARSVEHFERLLCWLGEHDERLRSG
jgi:aminoglycoside phosphotransferase